VLPEHHIVLNADDVEGIIWVVLLKVHQDLKLYSCLVLETLLISDQLNRDVLLGFVVEAFDSLPERAFPKELEDLKPVGNLVPYDYLIVTSIIIIAKVIRMQGGPFDLLGSEP